MGSAAVLCRHWIANVLTTDPQTRALVVRNLCIVPISHLSDSLQLALTAVGTPIDLFNTI